MNSVGALEMPKHLIIIKFDRYFCSRCAHAAAALMLPCVETCSRAFNISQVLPFAALHCRERGARFIPKLAKRVVCASVALGARVTPALV